MATEVQVRPGMEADLEALTDIYHHYVRETALTGDTVPLTPEQRRPWLRSHL
ncbi:GNAT family N-acetyltransferase [Streptomyces sp. NPDC060054]|uniref:GNAT family N-acetyltransferase n=1 Tax=unclassified Streptomyces TaxID=2593676 RepID=UPI00368D3555